MAAPLAGRAAGAAAGRSVGRASVPKKATNASAGASAPVDAQPAEPSVPKKATKRARPKKATNAPAGASAPVDAQPAEPDPEQAKPNQKSTVDGEPPAWRANVSSTVDNGAGFLLGVLLWGWVVMPFLRGGKTEVANVLRAKFLNRAPDGTWLP